MKKIIFITFILGSFFSCSRLDIAFDFAPRLIANNLDDSFGLSSERYKKIKEIIKQDLNKNKKELITDIINKIDEVITLSENKEMSLADIKKTTDSIRALQKKFIYAFQASFSEVLLSTSQKEYEHLKEFSEEKFKKADERLLDKEKYFEHANESFEKTMDILFDSTNKEQTALYKQFVEDNYDYFKYQIEVRKNFLNKYASLIDKKEELLTYTMKYYSGDDSVKSAEYIKKQEIFFANMAQLELDVWNKSTDKQKLQFRKNLTEIKEELRTIIK